MKVKINLVTNSIKINEALKINATNEQNRQYDKDFDGQDVEVPEEQIKESDLLIDVSKVDLAFVDSEGFIHVNYIGKDYRVNYNDAVWEQLEKRFK